MHTCIFIVISLFLLTSIYEKTKSSDISNSNPISQGKENPIIYSYDLETVSKPSLKLPCYRIGAVRYSGAAQCHSSTHSLTHTLCTRYLTINMEMKKNFSLSSSRPIQYREQNKTIITMQSNMFALEVFSVLWEQRRGAPKPT